MFIFVDFQLNFVTEYQRPQLCVVQKLKSKKIQSLLVMFCMVQKKLFFLLQMLQSCNLYGQLF
jgi:hypothetical protein